MKIHAHLRALVALLLLTALAVACASRAAAQSTHSVVMQTGPLDLAAPTVQGDEGYHFNFRLGGNNFFIMSEQDFTWGGGPASAVAMQCQKPAFAFVTPAANGSFYFAGNIFVGLPSYGAGALTVKGTLTAQGDITEGGAQLSRWRGTGTSDPSSPQAGDLFYRTDTSKVRIYAAGGWINLN